MVIEAWTLDIPNTRNTQVSDKESKEFAVPQDAPLRIDSKELFSAQVEDYLEVQSAMQRGAAEIEPQSWLLRMIYSSWFYLSLCAGLGGFCGWLIMGRLTGKGYVTAMNSGVRVSVTVLFWAVLAC